MQRPSPEELRVDAVYRALGRQRPSLAWAKAELALGLIAIAIAALFASSGDVLTWLACPLVALGGYLTLAGHRTHLYDAMTRQTALLYSQPLSSDQCTSQRA